MSTKYKFDQAHNEASITEWQYGICWFCRSRPQDNASTVNVKMYGNVATDFHYWGIIKRWQKLSINVPRCKQCRWAHISVHIRQVLIITLFLILGSLLVVVADMGLNNGWLGFAFLLILAIIGAFIAKRIKPKIIYPEDFKKQFPDVQKLISQGWKFGNKP